MKIFIDTANIDEIRKAHSWGIIDGVTTNPTLIAREGTELKEQIRHITDIVDGPISVEVMGHSAEDMIKEARVYSDWSDNIVIKIPMTMEGLRAVHTLENESIITNVTLVFSIVQVLLAAKAGASYVSPFIGRIDDTGHDGMQVVRDSMIILGQYEYPTKLIVASIRHPLHVREAAIIGADIVTVPFQILEKMFGHPLTDIGIDRFIADWERAGITRQ